MRIIHNITFLIDPVIHVAWYNYMVETLLPYYLESETINAYKLSKIVSLKNTDGLNFALQLEFNSPQDWEKYVEFIEPDLQVDLGVKFQAGALTFATTMEILEQG